MQAIRSTRPGGHVGFVGVSHDVAIPGDDLFMAGVHIHGGPAPVRRFLPELVQLIWDRTIEPGKVFDLTLPLEQSRRGLPGHGPAHRHQGPAHPLTWAAPRTHGEPDAVDIPLTHAAGFGSVHSRRGSRSRLWRRRYSQCRVPNCCGGHQHERDTRDQQPGGLREDQDHHRRPGVPRHPLRQPRCPRPHRPATRDHRDGRPRRGREDRCPYLTALPRGSTRRCGPRRRRPGLYHGPATTSSSTTATSPTTPASSSWGDWRVTPPPESLG